MPSSGKINGSAIGRKIVKLDPRFSEVVERFGPCPIGTKPSKISNFASLAESIMGQQLSIKAADTIIGRVSELAGHKLDPKRLARISINSLRNAGCSAVKARAVKELADSVNSGALNLRTIARKSDEDIYQTLLPLYGVGRWTVDMFMIFQIGKIDIWPVGDLGVRRGWEKVHSLEEEISPSELQIAGDRFRPFRTHLAWYCWRAHSIY
jgi:DNA-3-methyladenine glycosylase II